jgi:dihydroorotase
MELTLVRPDDWHLHVRDGAALQHVVPHTARRFKRAIIMPNLKPPVTTTEQALAYRERILAAAPAGSGFTPLMTLYLTDNTPAEEIRRAKQSGHIHAVKLYPAGATTHSDAGVTRISNTYAALEAMAEVGLPLLVHAEQLRIVLEHVTTREGIGFVQSAPDSIAATITAHHLLLNRNAMFRGGLRPHAYCLPVLKRETHRAALLEAATSGSPRFFLGTDSAPHTREDKESACGCAGIYTAHAALELYAQAFEEAGALDRLEGFASRHGPDFYGLAQNSDTLTLEKIDWQVPERYPLGDSSVIPLRAGETLHWRIRE